MRAWTDGFAASRTQVIMLPLGLRWKCRYLKYEREAAGKISTVLGRRPPIHGSPHRGGGLQCYRLVRRRRIIASVTSILQDLSPAEELLYCLGCQFVGQLVGMVVGDVHPQAIGPHPAIDFQKIESR